MLAKFSNQSGGLRIRQHSPNLRIQRFRAVQLLLSAARNNSSSGMLLHRKYERRDAIS